MQSKTCFVQCTYENGIFDNEYAVEINAGGSESFSLFAWRDLVSKKEAPNKGFLEAQILEQGKDFDVVVLPGETLETGRSIVRLPSRLVTTP